MGLFDRDSGSVCVAMNTGDNLLDRDQIGCIY